MLGIWAEASWVWGSGVRVLEPALPGPGLGFLVQEIQVVG